MATTVIDTLITKVKFETDSTGIKRAGASVKKFKTQALAALAPIVDIFTGGALINNIADTADEMIKFADSTGIAIDALQDLEFATERQGGSIGGLRSSIIKLSKNFGEFATLGTGEGKAVFEELGISARNANGEIKSVDQVLIELNKSFETLSKTEQISFARKVGINAGTIRLLQTAPKELENLINQSKEFGRVTEEEARGAAAFNDELTNLSTELTRLSQKTTLAVLPSLTNLLDTLGDVIGFVRKNSQFFKVLTGVVAAGAAGWLVFSGALLKVGLAIRAVTTALLLSPLGAFVLAAAVAALIIDDLIVAFKGGKSAIGDFFQEFLGIDIVPILRGIVKAWDVLVDTVILGASKLLGRLKPITDVFRSIGRGVSSVFGGGESATVAREVERFIQPGRKSFGSEPPIAQSPVFARSRDQALSQPNSVTIGDVNVNVSAGSVDSAEIARNVGSVTKAELRNAANAFDSGVAR